VIYLEFVILNFGFYPSYLGLRILFRRQYASLITIQIIQGYPGPFSDAEKRFIRYINRDAGSAGQKLVNIS